MSDDDRSPAQVLAPADRAASAGVMITASSFGFGPFLALGSVAGMLAAGP